ncbi:hypothetical protein RN001_011102 [Aquatica leii]|uniref:C2H2-type domain-containing protein n=1 Tax=Aquatica leii TaxID=1421715 RepID=A0AAN7S8U1_9COLE|nr:hypothetical protein RN001_011102 [Aquatica leii]
MNQAIKPDGNYIKQEPTTDTIIGDHETSFKTKTLKGRSLECTHCKKVFHYPSRLDKHLKSHSDERPFKCTLCPKVFKEARCLDLHFKLHSDVRLFKCNYCNKDFKSNTNLKQHLLTHSEKKPFACELCNLSFNRKDRLTQHIIEHARIKQCILCLKSFKTSYQLAQHKKTHVSEKLNTKDGIKQELPTASSNTLFDEIKIKEEFKLELNDDPMQTLDKTGILREAESRVWLECLHCKKIFLHKSKLAQHLITHSTGRPFKCEQCPKTFKEARWLGIHLKVHLGIRSFKCNKCGKDFTSNGYLKQHLVTHSVEKPFKCKQCDRSFTRKETLKHHVISHTLNHSSINQSWLVENTKTHIKIEAGIDIEQGPTFTDGIKIKEEFNSLEASI